MTTKHETRSTKHETDLRLARECVAVWKKKAELAAEGKYAAITLGIDACPLCQEYFDESVAYGEECSECPICQDTLGAQCRNTPYGRVTSALHTALWIYDNATTGARAAQTILQSAIAAEIAYLEELCAKLERPSKTQNPEQEAC